MAPREAENNAYAKRWGDEQRAFNSMLWYSGQLKNAFALVCRRLLFPSLHRNFLSVSNSRTLSFVEEGRFLSEQKAQFAEIPLLETLLILPNPSFKTNFSHLVESEND